MCPITLGPYKYAKTIDVFVLEGCHDCKEMKMDVVVIWARQKKKKKMNKEFFLAFTIVFIIPYCTLSTDVCFFLFLFLFFVKEISFSMIPYT